MEEVGSSLTKVDSNDQNVLHLASSSKNIDLLHYLMTFISNKDEDQASSLLAVLLNQRDVENLTPLLVSASINHMEAVVYFLDFFSYLSLDTSSSSSQVFQIFQYSISASSLPLFHNLVDHLHLFHEQENESANSNEEDLTFLMTNFYDEEISKTFKINLLYLACFIGNEHFCAEVFDFIVHISSQEEFQDLMFKPLPLHNTKHTDATMIMEEYSSPMSVILSLHHYPLLKLLVSRFGLDYLGNSTLYL